MCLCVCVSYLRTSCLVPSDFRLGSWTGQTGKKRGVVGRQEEERTVEGFSLSDVRKREGDGRRLSRRVGCVCVSGGVAWAWDGRACLRYENGHSSCP